MTGMDARPGNHELKSPALAGLFGVPRESILGGSSSLLVRGTAKKGSLFLFDGSGRCSDAPAAQILVPLSVPTNLQPIDVLGFA